MVKHFNLLTKASILLALVFYNTTYSQYNNPNFKNYFKFGVFLGAERLPVSNEKNGVDYALKTQRAYSFGLEYNFHSYRNYNFKAALIYRTYNRKNIQNFKKEDSGLPYNYAGEVIIGSYEQYKIPITTEYSFFSRGKISTYIGIGPELIYFSRPLGSGSLLLTKNDGSQSGYTEKDISKNGEFFLGLNTSLGMNISTKHLLIKPYINYHFQPKDLYTNEVTTQNLPVSQNGTSHHKIKGDYLMFGVSLFPSKSIFKKRQNK